MTEGISKETLLGINPWQHDNQQDLLNAIIGLCADLDPWLPIEIAPKDGCIWLWNGKNKCLAIWFRDAWREIVWVDTENTDNNFTHYKLLPDDPK